MEILEQLWSFFYHLIADTGNTLDILVSTYGTWIYAIMFIVIFCETGLVVTPFLPGDSLLFLLAAITARENNGLSILVVITLLILAAIAGDAANYTIGKLFGEKLFSNPDSKIFKQSYLLKTNAFYEKHGGKTIILARFVPIVRTFAPFVAGMSKMTYHHFFIFNVVGAILWVTLFSLLGYFVGTLPFVQENLKLVVIAIILLSIVPGVIEYLRNRKKR